MRSSGRVTQHDSRPHGFGSAEVQRGTLLAQLLETFVLQELRRMASWQAEPIAFQHFRDKDGVEVDLVLERGADEVVGVEVKAAASVKEADFRGLRKAAGRTRCGLPLRVVLYDGEHALPFGAGLFAVPIRALWETAGRAAERRG